MIKWIKSFGMQSFIVILLSAVLLTASFQAVQGIAKRQQTDQSKAIEAVLVKSAIQCYALEGSYPSDLYYLRDHYGVILDEVKYFYFYDVEGANILPKIVVIKR